MGHHSIGRGGGGGGGGGFVKLAEIITACGVFTDLSATGVN